MQIEVMRSKPRVVKVSGEIDITNSAQLGVALDLAVRESPRGVVVDMSKVTYLDSTGIHTLLVSCRRLTPHGGKLVLVVEHPNVRRILDILHLDKLAGLTVYRDVPSAEQAFSTVQV